ncbi:MAG: hypothetical protein RR728_06560 [Oscillospiraceae bacterium]
MQKKGKNRTGQDRTGKDRRQNKTASNGVIRLLTVCFQILKTSIPSGINN